MNNLEFEIDCDECENGTVHVQDTMCGQLPSNCCGGCTKPEDCIFCDGSGRISVNLEEECEDELGELREALETISEKLSKYNFGKSESDKCLDTMYSMIKKEIQEELS